MKMIKIKKKKTDRKLQFAALGLWWLVFFIAFMCITEIFSPLVSGGCNIAYNIIVCAVLAVIFDVVTYTLILPNMMKNSKIYKTVMHEMSVHGMSEQLKDYIVEQYNICAKKPDDNYMYMIDYAVLIAAYYSDIDEDFTTAYRYLDSVDYSRLNSFLKYSGVKEKIIYYYLVKLQIECDAEDRGRADCTYHNIMDFCKRYQCEEQMKSLKTAELVFYSYDVLYGHYQSVVDSLGSITYDDDNLTILKLSVMSKAYIKLGDFSKALAMLEQALAYTKFDYDKSVVMKEINKLKETEKINI